jgi:hypothetical protein
MRSDPRTISREISGVFEIIFPHLISRVVAYLNRLSVPINGFKPLDQDLMSSCCLQKSMLFELATVYAEALLNLEEAPPWGSLLARAASKQRLHYDADIPVGLEFSDKAIAKVTGENLIEGLKGLVVAKNLGMADIVIAPKIPGYSWISSGVGDFSVGDCLVEVKCSAKNFSSADYRQVLMYWLMSYLHAIEKNSVEWKSFMLINPRLNKCVLVGFDDLVRLVSPGGSKLQLIESFRAAVDVGGNSL